MSTLATIRRILLQLRADPRTVGLLLVAPCVLTTLLAYVFSGTAGMFDRVGPALLGIFPLVTMFVVTSVTTLQERATGTLERLLTLPIRKLDIVLGYAGAFAVVALAQTLIISALALDVLRLHVRGPSALLVLVALLAALLGTALGLLASACAATEFQAVQFLPAFLLPQLLVCGVFVPRPAMARPLQLLSDICPLTYVVDAMDRGVQMDDPSAALSDLVIIIAFILGSVAVGALTLRRRTP